jgi:acetolactate synthase-1/2/3 large subunit
MVLYWEQDLIGRFDSQRICPDVKLIQIDIEPSEIGVNKTPTVGIVGDIKEALQRILAEMKPNVSQCRRSDLSSWHCVLNEERERKQRRLESLTSNDSLPMTPHRMLKEIRDVLPRDAVCILDGNIFMAAHNRFSVLFAGVQNVPGRGCLGVGIPFGIGPTLGRTASLSLSWRYRFAFNAMDMETAVRHGVAVIIVVVNNGVIAARSCKSFLSSGQ